MYKKILFCLLFILISVQSIHAQASRGFFEQGLTIELGHPEYVPNDGFKIHIHAFNTSNGIPIVSGLQCAFHLYDSYGSHIYKNDSLTTTEGFDYECIVPDGIMNDTFGYGYIVSCNNSVGGGFEDGILYAGEPPTEARSIFYIGFLAVLCFFLMFSIFAFINFESLGSKVASLGISYILLLVISFIIWTMSDNFLNSSPVLVRIFYVIFIVLISGTFPLFIGGFAYYVLKILRLREIEQLMNKGYTYEEAERRRRR